MLQVILSLFYSFVKTQHFLTLYGTLTSFICERAFLIMSVSYIFMLEAQRHLFVSSRTHPYWIDNDVIVTFRIGFSCKNLSTVSVLLKPNINRMQGTTIPNTNPLWLFPSSLRAHFHFSRSRFVF